MDTNSDEVSIFASILQTEINERQQDSDTDTDGDGVLSAIKVHKWLWNSDDTDDSKSQSTCFDSDVQGTVIIEQQALHYSCRFGDRQQKNAQKKEIILPLRFKLELGLGIHSNPYTR